MAGEVRAAKCRECGKLTYPLHFYCPACHGTEFEAVPVAGDGTLLTWTRTYNLALDYAVRYVTLGIVEMDMGVRATGQLDIAEPKVGARVRASVGKVREIGGKDIAGLIFSELPESPNSRRRSKTTTASDTSAVAVSAGSDS